MIVFAFEHPSQIGIIKTSKNARTYVAFYSAHGLLDLEYTQGIVDGAKNMIFPKTLFSRSFGGADYDKILSTLIGNPNEYMGMSDVRNLKRFKPERGSLNENEEVFRYFVQLLCEKLENMEHEEISDWVRILQRFQDSKVTYAYEEE